MYYPKPSMGIYFIGALLKGVLTYKRSSKVWRGAVLENMAGQSPKGEATETATFCCIRGRFLD